MPNCAKYSRSSSTVVFVATPPTNTFLVLVTNCIAALPFVDVGVDVDVVDVEFGVALVGEGGQQTVVDCAIECQQQQQRTQDADAQMLLGNRDTA